MVGLFKQKSSSNIVMLFLLAFFLKLPMFLIVPKPILKVSDGPFYKWIMEYMNEVYAIFPFFITLIVLLIHFTIALLITRLLNNNKFMAKPNFLPAMAYILVTSLVKEFNYLSAPLIASLLLVLSFISIYNTYHQQKNNNNILMSGFLLGLASLFFVPTLGLIIGIFICLAVLKPFKLSEWFVLTLGVLCPFYFYFSFLYLTDQWYLFFDLIRSPSFGFKFQSFSILFLLAMFLLLMPLLVGIFYTQANEGRLLIHVRKGWQLIFLMILLCVLVSLVDMGIGFENWLLILPFVAMFHGYGYKTSTVKLYPLFLFWASILLAISNYIIK